MATIQDIKQRAQQVKDATQIGENTANRVGGVLVDMADHLEQDENQLSTLYPADATPTAGSTKPVQSGGVHELLSQLFPMDETPTPNSAKPVKSGGVHHALDGIQQQIDGKFDYTYSSGYIAYTNGVKQTSTANYATSYIDISGCEEIIYTRFEVQSSSSVAGMAFYDGNRNYISGQRCILNKPASKYVPTTIAVPENAKYARFTILGDLPMEDFYVKKTDSLNAQIGLLEQQVGQVEDDVAQIEATLNDIIEYDFAYASGYIAYNTGGKRTPSSNYVTSFIDVSQSKKLFYTRMAVPSTSTTAGMAFYDEGQNYISGERCLTGMPGEGYYVETEIAVPENAKYARFTILGVLPMEDFYVKGDINSISELKMEIEELNDKISSTLKGKKVSIIGDSISCFGTAAQTRENGYNAPYWIVKQVDVGNDIQSYVTWLDVYTTVDSTTLINKTIGGVLITPDMIGTLQTFRPTAEDVGKAIGVARWASNYTESPWWQVMISRAGATLCNNASWSGSRIIAIPEGHERHDAFVMSEAYSEYTLGRVRNRDENGNFIIPDVVIIYRGTNDFSALDPEGGGGAGGNESITTPNMLNFVEPQDWNNFTECYIWTILKLREKYPNTSIILCTMNIFKARNASHYPPNNGTNTLVDYNNKIREIADLMGCGIIEFDKDGITYENCYPTYISDSAATPIHPNTLGHQIMGNKAYQDVNKNYNPL